MWSGGKKFPAGALQKMAALESSPCTPAKAATATIHKNPSNGTPLKHLQPKLPSGDSPYVRAKHVQLVEKDPNKAIPLFWAAINSGDRVDSALKDMAVVMKQVNRADEAIEAVKSLRYLCSSQAQEPLDNVLLDLYKKCGRIDDQIELLNFKLKMIDDGLAFGGRTTKLARSQGKKFHLSLVREKSRLLGNLAWVYMQSDNYMEAESLYRQALAIEPDQNKQCNLAICLMKTGRLAEAKSLLQDIEEPSREVPFTNSSTESYLRSFERASEMLMTLESQSELNGKFEGLLLEGHNITATTSNTVNGGRSEDFNGKNLLNEFSSPWSVGKSKKESVSQRVPSPPSCSWKYPKYVTPSSKTINGRWVKWPGFEEDSADIYKQRSKPSCNKALFSPASVDGSTKLDPIESLTPENNLALITESMKPAEDPSIFTNGRKHFGEPAVQSCSADVHILEPKIPIQLPNQVSFGSLSTSMNVNQIQGSDVPTDTGGQIEILGEKFPQGVPNNGNSQNSDNASASIDNIPKFRGDNPVSYGGKRTWADMVEEEEEEEEENLANENLSIDIVADHAIGSCKNSSEEHFNTPPALNSRKYWADMVEKEESLANGNLSIDILVADHTIGSCKNSSEEHFKTPPALNSRKSWADMVEEEESLAYGNLNHSAEINSHSGSCKHASTEQPACKGFPDENVNFINIVRSTPGQKHQMMPQNHTESFCQKLSMLDMKEGSESGSKTPRKNSLARRSLSFDQQPMWDLSKDCFPEEGGLQDPLHMVAIRSQSNCEMNLKRAQQRNRLRVFQEITLDDSARD